jgi:hypothetical protein
LEHIVSRVDLEVGDDMFLYNARIFRTAHKAALFEYVRRNR